MPDIKTAIAVQQIYSQQRPEKGSVRNEWLVLVCGLGDHGLDEVYVARG